MKCKCEQIWQMCLSKFRQKIKKAQSDSCRFQSCLCQLFHYNVPHSICSSSITAQASRENLTGLLQATFKILYNKSIKICEILCKKNMEKNNLKTILYKLCNVFIFGVKSVRHWKLYHKSGMAQ